MENNKKTSKSINRTLTLQEEDLTELKKLSETTGLNKSAIVRFLIRKYSKEVMS